jgi:hypothetical protein
MRAPAGGVRASGRRRTIMETTNTTATPNAEPHAEGLRESIVGLGAAWARYGLRLGSVALENQSRHLEACGKALGEALAHTAKALSNIADNMKKEPEKTEDDGKVVIDMPVDQPHG